MSKLSYCIYILLIFSLSCKQKAKDEESKINVEFNNQYSFKLIKDKEFFLDSLTDSERIWANYLEDKNGKRYLYVLSHLDFSVQKYDWNSGNIINRMETRREGPEGIGRPFDVFAKTSDSIFLLSPFDFKLSLINDKGKVLKRYSLFDSKAGKISLGNGVLALGDLGSQMAIMGSKIFISAMPNDDYKIESFYKNGNVGLILDLNFDKIDYLMKIPKVFLSLYDEGSSLSAQQITFGQALNPKKGTCIVNFPTDNDLYEVNVNTKKITKHYAGSQLFNKIEFITKDRVDARKEYEYFVKQPYFSGIQYDPYRNVYIRFMSFPNPSKQDPFDTTDGIPTFQLYAIILDENFKKVGEIKISKDYWEPKSIITPEGIYLLKHVEIEDKLVYSLFKIEKTNEQVN